MLIEDRKNQIRDEEIFREEVRRELSIAKPEPNSRAKILGFFNSPLGIWLLSYVFLAGIVFGYQLINNKFRVNAENKKQASFIDLEVSTRLKRTVAAFKEGDTNHSIVVSISKLEESSTFFPQFNNRPIVSLVQELVLLVSETEQNELQEAKNRLIELLEKQRLLAKPNIGQIPITNENRELIAKLIDMIMISRW